MTPEERTALEDRIRTDIASLDINAIIDNAQETEPNKEALKPYVTMDKARAKEINDMYEMRRQRGQGVLNLMGGGNPSQTESFRESFSNGDGNDCGRAALLNTYKERMEYLYTAPDVLALANAIQIARKDPNQSLVEQLGSVSQFLGVGGGSQVNMSSTIQSSLAAAFMCITIDVSNSVTMSDVFKQEINLTCRDQVTQLYELCSNPNTPAGNCAAFGDVLKSLCSVNNVSQNMYFAISTDVNILNDISQAVTNELEQRMQETQDITEDMINNMVESLESLGVTLLGGDVAAIKRLMQDATSLFVADIDVNMVNDIVAEIEASQIIKIEAVETAFVSQTMAIDIVRRIMFKNTLAQSADNAVTQALESMFKKYVKSLDDYIKAIGSLWSNIAIVGLLMLGGLVVIGLIFFLVMRGSGGSNAPTPAPLPPPAPSAPAAPST